MTTTQHIEAAAAAAAAGEAPDLSAAKPDMLREMFRRTIDVRRNIPVDAPTDLTRLHAGPLAQRVAEAAGDALRGRQRAIEEAAAARQRAEAERAAERAEAERAAERARVDAGGIPQHSSVRAQGPAKLHGAIFRGGRRGVELTHRDTDIVGYPIPLQDGTYLRVRSFGRHRYHEDAPPMVIALGTIIRERAARRALEAHEPTRRARAQAALDAARVGDSWHDATPEGRLIARQATATQRRGGFGTDWFAAEDGRVMSITHEYDWPPCGRRYGLGAAEVIELLRAAGAEILMGGR